MSPLLHVEQGEKTMSLFMWILIAILLFGVVSKFYDAGKYAHGGKDLRQGVQWSVICILGAIVNAIFVLGIWMGW
jgi:hypothetical protein